MSDYGNEGGEDFEVEWPADDADGGWPDDDAHNGENAGPEIEMKNTFYTAEDIKRSKPEDAIDMFENVIIFSESLDNEVKYRFQSL